MFHVSELSDVTGSMPQTGGHGRTARAPDPMEPIEFDSARLLAGRRELLIRHGNETYRLRHTRNDKLILTK